jgi:hypothetical protein
MLQKRILFTDFISVFELLEKLAVLSVSEDIPHLLNVFMVSVTMLSVAQIIQHRTVR